MGIFFESPTILDPRCDGLHYAVTRDQSPRVLFQHKLPRRGLALRLSGSQGSFHFYD
jgi:hypothetical protein